MENSEFSWALDDLMNIHGSWHVVLQVIAPDELIVGAPFGICLEPGEELTFYAPPYGVKRSVATILDAHPLPREMAEYTLYDPPDTVMYLEKRSSMTHIGRSLTVRAYP